MKKLSLLLASFVLLIAFPVIAHADDCEYERKIELNLDLSGTETLAIVAGAGSLSIAGKAGLGEAEITGTVCASSEEWLDQSRIETRTGNVAKIEVDLPETDRGWSFFGDNYASIDLELVVPGHIELDVVDSSGSVVIHGVGALSLTDSSGSIKIEDMDGPLRLKDSSGSISLKGIGGDVTVVADGSGSISGKDINGSVLVKEDSSGGMNFQDVSGDFIVERDSSGGIVAERIGGDFRVLKDGSGGIRSSDVAGEVSIPRD